MKRLKIFFLAFFIVQVCAAQKYDFNPRCIQAYNYIQELRFTKGKQLLELEKKENPQNLIPYYVENYIDWLTTYIDENEAEFKRLEPNKNIRLDKLETGDKNSPYFLYCKAELLIQWAFSKLKFEEYLSAFTDVRKAYLLLEENQKKFPDFVANKKSLGMLHAIVGAIPDQYKWGVNLLGMDGTIDQGLKELKSIFEYSKTHEFIFEHEVYLYYAFLILYLGKDDVTSWNIVKDLDTKTNLLNVFFVSSIAMRTGRNDLAISILKNKPTGADYFPYQYLDFMLGLAKTRKLEADASSYFEKFIQNYKGKNYIKEAYQKMAWNALLNGDKEKYWEYMYYVKARGDDLIDDDKQALYEAESKHIPNATLLKSRLLFDGGYYKEAMQQLEGKSIDNFSDERDKAEFTYRAGRIWHAAGQPDKAKGFYLSTIKIGEDLPYFYAANAALQLGIIYEKENDFSKAKYYYQLCIDMPNEEYKTSLEGLAKAGLNR
ncbi:MAG: tol-pal system YbgF family protein, partial [Chitinophagales bacterium]